MYLNYVHYRLSDGFECRDDLILKSLFVQLKSEVNRILHIDETLRILGILEISLSVKVTKAVGACIFAYEPISLVFSSHF